MTEGQRFFKETNFSDCHKCEIPNDWKNMELREVATDLIGGGTPSTAFKEYWNGHLAWMTSAHINGRVISKGQKYITKQGLDNSATHLVPKDNLLVATRVGIGKVAVNQIDIAISQDLTGVIVDKTKADPSFLYWEILNNKQKLKALAQGSTIKGILRADLGKLRLPMPLNISEQSAIVGVLGVVDSAIEYADQIIAKSERLKQGLMQQLLTNGIGHTEYKQTPIGKIPDIWQIVKLGDALEKCQYGLSVKFGEDGKYPILKMDDIANGAAIPDYAKRVDLNNQTFGNFKLEKGDVLFNRTNSYEHVGRTGIFLLDGDYTFASYLIRLRPKKDLLDSQFLTFYLIYSHERLKQLATRAVHQANINATNLQSVTIALPPLQEQKRIAEVILTVDKKLGLENKEKARLEQIKKGLMDLLLTGKVRIRVD